MSSAQLQYIVECITSPQGMMVIFPFTY